MKLTILTISILLCSTGFSQVKLATIESEEDWEKVIITRNNDDVTGLVSLEEIEVKSSKPFGSQKKLRKSAKEKLQREAAILKAPIVLINSDVFSQSPINNVTIIAMTYLPKKKE